MTEEINKIRDKYTCIYSNLMTICCKIGNLLCSELISNKIKKEKNKINYQVSHMNKYTFVPDVTIDL
jgi:hypothetical protein